MDLRGGEQTRLAFSSIIGESARFGPFYEKKHFLLNKCSKSRRQTHFFQNELKLFIYSISQQKCGCRKKHRYFFEKNSVCRHHFSGRPQQPFHFFFLRKNFETADNFLEKYRYCFKKYQYFLKFCDKKKSTVTFSKPAFSLGKTVILRK